MAFTGLKIYCILAYLSSARFALNSICGTSIEERVSHPQCRGPISSHFCPNQNHYLALKLHGKHLVVTISILKTVMGFWCLNKLENENKNADAFTLRMTIWREKSCRIIRDYLWMKWRLQADQHNDLLLEEEQETFQNGRTLGISIRHMLRDQCLHL